LKELVPGVDGTSKESKLLLLYRKEDCDIFLYNKTMERKFRRIKWQ
jgi:hypothetical protein